MTYRARIRVRIAKAFTTDETERVIRIANRPVRVTGGEKGQKLSEAKWLVLNGGGFDTEASALSFGHSLRLRLEVASFSCRLGLDGGVDKPTSWMNEEWAKSQSIIGPKDRCLPNVHGVTVVRDDSFNRFPVFNIEGVVTMDPEAFFRAVEDTDAATQSAPTSIAAVRIMNLALMTPEPLAALVLAFSAIEELGQGETWTGRQREILSEIAGAVENSQEDVEARKEIGAALRSLHRLSLRRGVMRVLERLERSDLRSEWDRLYGIRSGIFHGSARLSADETQAFTQEVMTLCGKIVLAQLRSDGVRVPAAAAVSCPD